jgi:hypothetical protein
MFVSRSRPAQANRLRILPYLAVLLALAIHGTPLAGAQKEPVPQQPEPTGNCTHSEPAARPDCSGAIAFLAKFQNALKNNNREAIASLVNYPLRVPDAVGTRRIRSRAQLLANFDRVFTPPIRAAVLKATADDVWGNSHGFMIGRGVIWFEGIIPPNERPDASAADYWTKYPFKVITVNPAYP